MLVPVFDVWALTAHGGNESSYPAELDGAMRRFLRERGRDLDRWFMAVRSIFAVGLVGFLSIDVVLGARPTTVLVVLLAGYVIANLLAWSVVGRRTGGARWLYMAIDVTAVLVVRHVFGFETAVEPTATMVGMFTLLLLTYTIYGDPRLTLALTAAAAAGTVGTVGLSMAGISDPSVYADQPFRAVLLVGYLAAFCALTIGLSRRLRAHVVQHGLELLKRLEASVTTSVERNRREKIEELNRLKRDFISVLSHELRTPLAPLRSSLDLLKCAGDGAVIGSELLEIAVESTDKLQRLVLDYTQLAELMAENETELIRWNFELEDFLDVLRCGPCFRQVETSTMSGLSVAVDPKLLAAGVLALLRRVQLASSTAPIALSAHSHGGDVTLTVHDTDSYIDRDLSEVLDDPFGLSSERTFSANTGLELILARYALQRTGGSLRVTSSISGGTTAFCTVPGERSGLAWLDSSQMQDELESLLLYAVR